MQRRGWLIAAAALALLAGAALTAADTGATRLELADAATGRTLLAITLADGEPVWLYWRNSLFQLDVVETFRAQSGMLRLNEVEFRDPAGRPPAEVGPV